MQLDLDISRKQASDLKDRLADKDRELLAVKTDLSAVQKDSILALNELKDTDKLISESLTAELERQREETGFLTSERDALKSQLIDALLANDKFRKDIDENKDLQDSVGSSADQNASGMSKKSEEKIEKLRARLIERNQVSKTLLFLNLFLPSVNFIKRILPHRFGLRVSC